MNLDSELIGIAHGLKPVAEAPHPGPGASSDKIREVGVAYRREKSLRLAIHGTRNSHSSPAQTSRESHPPERQPDRRAEYDVC